MDKSVAEKREKQRRRYREADTKGIEVIPAKPAPDFFNDESEKRVAVYVRVSTNNMQQTSSFEMQQKYYSDYIARRPGWRLHDIYSDEGISGTSLTKRDSFNKMIKDAMNGDFELIITKSMSRWSRNILDAVGIVRQLAAKRPPVGVFFENENLYSLDPDSSKQMTLSMHGTMAEHESRVKSASMNSSLQMRFSHGLFLTPTLLGYDHDDEKKLVINEDEANTVRLIFFMYMYGYATKEIADILTDYGRTTKKREIKWTSGSVLSVLRNERHCGDIVAWKTFTPNFLDNKCRKNKGDKPQYIKRDHHEAIISRDDFLAVQQMIDNAKYGGKGFEPTLRVDSEGALKGFVSVNPRWSFSADDYRSASKSVLEEPK